MSNRYFIAGRIVRGHQVASGKGQTPYPKGTIEMQTPHFLARGLDLSPYHDATINVSIAPHTFSLQKPTYTFHKVKWTEIIPAEDFSFIPCELCVGESQYGGLIYYPHPETKPHHFQSPSVLEILAPFIGGIGYGDAVSVGINLAEIAIH